MRNGFWRIHSLNRCSSLSVRDNNLKLCYQFVLSVFMKPIRGIWSVFVFSSWFVLSISIQSSTSSAILSSEDKGTRMSRRLDAPLFPMKVLHCWKCQRTEFSRSLAVFWNLAELPSENCDSFLAAWFFLISL